jgi:hypothetical protein
MKRVNLAGLLDGHYLVKDKKFQNKIEALRYASQFPELKDSDIKYLWNHDVWNNFDKSLLGKISLKELYRERAQQIKDQYDYLILYYSGGSDSHNILRTFLDNKIKLDEVVVKWPKKVVGTDLYTPNTIDRTARNFVSEWDFVIEKELNNLKLNHPDIKITVLDFMEDATPDYYTDDIFLNMNHMHSAINLLRMPCYTEMEMNPKGKRVVGIFSSRQTIKIFKPFFVSAQQAFIRAIDKKSTRELCQGPVTGTLLFCSNHPGDNVVNQEEAFACP